MTAGLGGSLVRYEGFLSSGAVTLTSAVQHETPTLTVGAQGSWTVFESGNPILQTTAAASWLAQPRARVGFELGGAAGVFRYASEPAAGHILARARAHLFAGQAGAWLGATSGASFGEFAETPVELALGAWSVHERVALVAGFSSTSIGALRFADLSGAAKWSSNRVELEARATARPWVNAEDNDAMAATGVWAEASALVRLGARATFTVSGGSYASDPVRRVLGATYVSAGLRLALVGSERAQPLTIPPALLAAVRAHNAATTHAEARLEITPEGEQHVLRVHAATASTVDVMGDFTDWQAQPLTRGSDGVWSARFVLAAGVHRLNIRIDGGEWLVPAGARSEEGEFGGAVGVVVVR